MTEDIERKVINNIDQNKTVRMLQELIRIPAWQDFTKPSTEWERARAEYLEDRLNERGFDTTIAGEVRYGQPTIIGFLRGREKGQPKLFFDAHLDNHSPLDPVLQPRPFDGQIEKGEVKGVGAADQLATIAACLNAVDAIQRSNIQLKRDFMVIFPSDEMIGARGIEVAVRWMKANNVKPEFGISGEATDNNIGVAQTGIIEFEVEVIGASGHPSHVLKGTGGKLANPVIRMFDVGKALLEIERKEERFKIEHPLVGTSYTWIGSIEGGTRFSGSGWSKAIFDPIDPGMSSYEAFTRQLSCCTMTPEYCKLRYGVRIISESLKPGETHTVKIHKGFHREELEEMVNKHLKELWRKSPSDCTYKLRVTQLCHIPYEISTDEPHVKLMAKVVEDATEKVPKFIGTKHWTEVSRVAEQIGSPFVQVAPTWARYHQPNEGCPITDMMATTRIYALAILRLCGLATLR